MNYLNKIIKFVTIIIVLTLSLPLLTIISLLTLIDSGLPIIHKREVIGLNGSKFTFYKYRTMVQNANEVLKQWKSENNKLYEEYKEHTKLKNDPRVTKTGKFLRKSSLDELPQLINVLKGQMNLIGPRPITYIESTLIDNEKLKIRNSVRPGITGLWQVNGRQETTFKQRIDLDIVYVKKRSILFDFKILLKTIPIVFRGKGAF
ncbi:uncharacterized protein METZ01_LOCUS299904 [marine metagenome]|uniref:Bacterial sugar transferase domain-containing protein n=1 Tax=marine metagenome TaxID=408172 RepID=A0A382MEG6_9ZZZZ